MIKASDFDAFSVHDVVEESSVEAVIEEKEIGARLKRLRLKKSMGLVELGQQSGLSASYLSQLETGRVVPTLRNLSRIAMVHKIDIGYFFSNTKGGSFKISRAKDRISIPSGNKEEPFMLSQSMSSLIPDRTIVPCIAELRPGFRSEVFDAHLNQGVEFAYVLQGSVNVMTAQRLEVLEEGDLLWIDGSVKRQYKCLSKDAAKVLIITFPAQR